jgi:hypothetical protein
LYELPELFWCFCHIYYSGTVLLPDLEGCACSLCGLWLRTACLGGRARTRAAAEIRAELQGDQKVSIHLMITVQKTRKKYFKQFQSLATIT